MDDHKPVDGLRLTQAERQRLLTRIEEARARDTGNRRQQPRVPCKFRSDPLVRIRQHGGQEHTFLSLARDISAGGMAFIHVCYLYPSTPVRVTLTALDGEQICVEGEVTHCEHVEGRFHEVGVRFAHPIDTHLFVTVSEDEAALIEESEASEVLKSVLGLVEAVNALKHLVAKSAQNEKIHQSLDQACDLLAAARMLITASPPSPECAPG